MRSELDSAIRFGLWLTYGNNTVEKWDSRRSASVPSGGIQRRLLSRKLRDLRRNWVACYASGESMRQTLNRWKAEAATVP